MAEANRLVEEEFERRRRGRSLSRLTALFAGADAADCVQFLRAQRDYDNVPVHLYRVDMPVSGHHPMALVDAVRRKAGHTNIIDKIVEEYWQPTLKWRFWEYLGQTMTVVEELPLPDTIMMAGAFHRYITDRDLAVRRWP